MAKKITGYIKLQVPAGKANPSPPIGPALGQRGLNIMEFCKAFNAATQGMEPGMPIPVVITAYADRTFTFVDQDAAGQLLPEEGGGSGKGQADAGQERSPARSPWRSAARSPRQKMKDLNANDLDAAVRDDRGLGPVDGHRGGGGLEPMAKQGKRLQGGGRGCRSGRAATRSTRRSPLLKGGATAKFDETIEIALNLGVDPRHADQMVRGIVDLPHGTGKTVRVAVFAKGDKADEAKAAGADVVGAEDLAEQVQDGQIDFDRCIATPDMMPRGRPAGPDPRAARPDAQPQARHRDPERRRGGQAAKGGQVQFRVEKAGIIHAGVGKASFAPEQLADNVRGVGRRGQQGQAERREGHLPEAGRI